MDLNEIYTAGRRFFEDKEYGTLLDYVETGFVRRNDRRIIDRYTFRQRCVGARTSRTGVEVAGIALRTPVIMSAMTMPIPAIGGDALLQLARGLKAAGSLMWTGTPIPANLNRIAATGVPLAANVKPLSDRTQMQVEIDRIIESGVDWLGLEIDAGAGTKVREREMGFECRPLTVAEIETIKTRIPVPLACKGILSREDAAACRDAGADILVVSNHGGHTLDYLPHPFQVMDEIVAEVNGRATLIVDGGLRRGSDVLKGLAFGATLAGLGRPILYALGAGGEGAVSDLINGITGELRRLMTLTGSPEPTAVGRDVLIADRP